MSRIMFLIYSSLLLSCVLLTGLESQGFGPAKVLNSGGQHCVSADYLSERLGATIQKQSTQSSIRISLGSKSVLLTSGSVLTASKTSLKLMPTCPTRHDGVFYVPTRATVESLGGSVEKTSTGLLVQCQGRSVELPLAVGSGLPGHGGSKLVADLHDPRVPLEDLAVVAVKSDQVNSHIGKFNDAATTLQPGLKAMSQSKILKLLGRVPLVGKAFSLSQDVAGAMDESIRATKYLEKVDGETSAPLRRAILAANRVAGSHDGTNIAAARRDWQAALPALDKRNTQTDRTIMLTQGLMTATKALDSVLGKLKKSKSISDVDAPVTFDPCVKSGEQLVTVLQAQKWQISTLKSYFSALIEDTDPSNG